VDKLRHKAVECRDESVLMGRGGGEKFGIRELRQRILKRKKTHVGHRVGPLGDQKRAVGLLKQRRRHRCV
jgi:hypothetical protein